MPLQGAADDAALFFYFLTYEIAWHTEINLRPSTLRS